MENCGILCSLSLLLRREQFVTATGGSTSEEHEYGRTVVAIASVKSVNSSTAYMYMQNILQEQ